MLYSVDDGGEILKSIVFVLVLACAGLAYVAVREHLKAAALQRQHQTSIVFEDDVILNNTDHYVVLGRGDSVTGITPRGMWLDVDLSSLVDENNILNIELRESPPERQP